MKSMKIAILGAIAVLSVTPAMALDSTITTTDIVGQTTAIWQNGSLGNSTTNQASVAVGQDSKGFTKEFEWSQTNVGSESKSYGNSVSTQDTKITSYSNSLNTFGVVNGKSAETSKRLGGFAKVAGVTKSGSFKVSVNGVGGVKLKDKIGAGSDFGGKKGAHNHGTYEPGAERPGMSIDITNTGKDFTDNAASIFENATVWTPNTSSQHAQDTKNKASMEFSKSASSFTQSKSQIKGITTTTSTTTGSFLN